MTETDRIEITNLLNSMKEIENYANETNRPYFDERIATYAKEAIEDYVGNKKQLIDIISGNLNLFLGDMKNFPISTGGACTEGYSAREGNKFTICLGSDLWITARLIDFNVVKNDGWKIFFNIRNIEISDIKFSTSDTKDERYSICCWENLVDRRDGFNATPLTAKRNAKGWECLLDRAGRTREMNRLLVSCFKEVMKEKIAKFREKANANEKTICELKHTAIVYAKVDL